MKIGVPKEIKDHEYRVGLVPASVAELVRRGHSVMVEKGAGASIGAPDADYVKAGAKMAASAAAVWEGAQMIVKVKEPLAAERKRLRPGQILFTYLHLAPDVAQTKDLVKSGATCVAYETVTAASGGLPLLTPMSEVAGRLAPQVGAHCLEKAQGGRGVLLGGVPGVPPGKVLVLGGGVSGTHAATIALGMGARVTVMDRSAEALRRLEVQFGGRVQTVFSTQDAIERALPNADLVIGAVLVPGAAAPKLITRKMLGLMQRGSVLVDIAIDQGGCFETSHATTHSDPTFVVDRHRALLRGQHARRGGAHLDLRAEQRHPALRLRAGRRGPERAAQRCAPARRPERSRRQGHLRTGGAGAQAQVRAGREGAGRVARAEPAGRAPGRPKPTRTPSGGGCGKPAAGGSQMTPVYSPRAG